MKPFRPFVGFTPGGGLIFVLLLMLSLPGFSVWAQEIAPTPRREPAHTVGVELDYLMSPFGFDDPYGWPLGGGVFYELRPLPRVRGLHVGATVSAFTLSPLDEDSSTSYMIQPGLYAGYDLLVSPNPDFTWAPGLYAGYKHYVRRHTLGEQDFLTYRPIALGGLRLKLWIGRRLCVSSGAEYNLIFENTLLHTVAFTQRLGLRLGGGDTQ